jgi:hypothetical protein
MPRSTTALQQDYYSKTTMHGKEEELHIIVHSAESFNFDYPDDSTQGTIDTARGIALYTLEQ